ncbi:PREDICTED: PX domain-containing protein kinase-like protein [Nicrophorus vespilloides]|uniref:PX domain-containing protein kinase-like protein n=1 Tax=Nicrophorus vespilloides TaxID=110193 RepID=A0ABM1M5L4_NICVS|nr:PREDICTED: PX domain-containing protein kinase-like protein [Nicrophorus vespilloides]
MAIFEEEISKKVTLDDTEPITCHIENWKTTNGHTEFVIKVHRGPFTNETWRIQKRYNDFFKLHSQLQSSGLQLPLPPKKLIGNMEPDFIAERQQGLQKYLNIILMNPILVSSLPARSFVDPANYCQPFSEQALQHVSLALRGEVGWEVVGPLPDIGWRLRKHYYQVKCKSLNKEELWATWADYGPDKYLEDKEMQAVFKSLSQIQHPYIHSLEMCLCTDVGGLVVRSFNKAGSIRDLLCGAKPKLSFMKKYGNPKGHKSFESHKIALYGRQILEALKFLHDKGLPYGHLHTGNILIDNERIKLLDIEDGILGVPSFYRPYFMQHKKINTLEAIDVYSFGHVLHEMTFGAPLHESVVEQLPQQDCPTHLRSVIESILSPEGCKVGVPTIDSLLMHPFFSSVILTLEAGDRAHLKFPNTAKDHLKVISTQLEDRLREEQKIMRNQKRLVRAQEKMSSEEEKKKQRHKFKQEQKQAREKMRQRTIEEKDPKVNGIGGDRSESVSNTSTANSIDTATPPSMSSSSVPSPPPPPPPPPAMTAPLLPATTAAVQNGGTALSNGATPQAKDRSALLGAICSFNKTALRKTKDK